jgi:hypothetical protein
VRVAVTAEHQSDVNRLYWNPLWVNTFGYEHEGESSGSTVSGRHEGDFVVRYRAAVVDMKAASRVVDPEMAAQIALAEPCVGTVVQ